MQHLTIQKAINHDQALYELLRLPILQKRLLMNTLPEENATQLIYRAN